MFTVVRERSRTRRFCGLFLSIQGRTNPRPIIMPMAKSASRPWANGSSFRLDREDPYLRLHHVPVFVCDQDRSLRFYLDQLGFSLVIDYQFGQHGRFVLVGPPDGAALLALIAPKPESEEYKLIGRPGQAVFVTDDITAKFHTWREGGVRFRHSPQTGTWGGTFTSFEDARSAQPMRHGVRSAATLLAIRESTLLREYNRQRLRHPLFCRI